MVECEIVASHGTDLEAVTRVTTRAHLRRERIVDAGELDDRLSAASSRRSSST